MTGTPATIEDILNDPGSRGRLLWQSRHGEPNNRHDAQALLREWDAAWTSVEVTHSSDTAAAPGQAPAVSYA